MAPTFVRGATVLVGLGTALGLTGCGKSEPSPYAFNNSVGGVVKLDGKPLPNALVQFVPADAGAAPVPTSSGISDETGRFTLAADKQKGAVLGKHKVVVNVVTGRGPRRGEPEREGDPPTVNLPTEYTTPAQTPIEVDVTADKHDYEINLSSKVE